MPFPIKGQVLLFYFFSLPLINPISKAKSVDFDQMPHLQGLNWSIQLANIPFMHLLALMNYISDNALWLTLAANSYCEIVLPY